MASVSSMESYGAKNRSALADNGSSAVSAGYLQLAQPGYAQTVISNAVESFIDHGWERGGQVIGACGQEPNQENREPMMATK